MPDRPPHNRPLPDPNLADTDRCVMCGLCLPHCPTYAVTRAEGDSPRGRIALMQHLAAGDGPPEPGVAAHLDRCLTCRACEAMCPSQVPFGRLMDAARANLARRRTPVTGWRRWAMDRLLPRRRRLRRLAAALRWSRRLGLVRLADATGLTRRLGLARAAALLPPLEAPPRWRAEYPARGAERGCVGLFLGCAGELAEPRVARAAIAVLTTLGWRVRVPAAQACCGALHLHGGDPAGARALAAVNADAFDDPDLAAVISTASGCGAQLAGYGGAPFADLPGARALAERSVDISTFLAGIEWPADIAPRPLPARIGVHTPCTLRNVLRDRASVPRLLRRIPALETVPVEGTGCCGAAGAYMLEQPALADTLRERLIADIAAADVTEVVTSNVGCALHLTAGLSAAGVNVPVRHPVELLARQLAPTR